MITMWKCKFVRANTNGHKATCVWSVWCSWQAWHQTFHWISSENEVMKSSIEGAFIAKAPSCAFRILGSLWKSWNQSLAKLPDLLAPCFLPALDDSSKFGCLISNLTNVVSFIFYIVLYSRLFCLSCLQCLHSLARRIVASKQCQSTDLWSRTLGPCGMGLTMASQRATEHKSDMPTEWHCASGRKKTHIPMKSDMLWKRVHIKQLHATTRMRQFLSGKFTLMPLNIACSLLSRAVSHPPRRHCKLHGFTFIHEITVKLQWQDLPKHRLHIAHNCDWNSMKDSCLTVEVQGLQAPLRCKSKTELMDVSLCLIPNQFLLWQKVEKKRWGAFPQQQAVCGFDPFRHVYIYIYICLLWSIQIS